MQSLCELQVHKLCAHIFHQTAPEQKSNRNFKVQMLKEVKIFDHMFFGSGQVIVPEAWDALLQFEQSVRVISWGKQNLLGWMENIESIALTFH